jgi:hypothetical protein
LDGKRSEISDVDEVLGRHSGRSAGVISVGYAHRLDRVGPDKENVERAQPVVSALFGGVRIDSPLATIAKVDLFDELGVSSARFQLRRFIGWFSKTEPAHNWWMS